MCLAIPGKVVDTFEQRGLRMAKVQFGGTIDLTLQAPNRLRMKTEFEAKDDREFFHNGSTLTIWLKDRNVWASAPVPPGIGEMLDQIRTKYDLEFPMDDVRIVDRRRHDDLPVVVF